MPNFMICIGDMIYDQNELFLFRKTWKYPSVSAKESWRKLYKISIYSETVAQIKTVILTPNLWD